MSFEKELEETQKETGSSTSWFKPEEGNNFLKVLAEPKLNVQVYNPQTKKSMVCYEGAKFCKDEYIEANGLRKSFKFLTWVIDRKDKQLKIYNMPFTVAKQIGDMKKAEPVIDPDGDTIDDGTAFDEFPMPYDIILDVTNAGTKEVEYKVTKGKKKELTAEEEEAFEKENTPEEIVASMKDKSRKEVEGDTMDSYDSPTPEEEGIDPDNIPF